MTFLKENMPSCSIAYFRRTGAYGTENFKTMERLKDWAQTQGRMTDDAVILGIAWDSPETPPEECRYDACLVVPDNTDLAEGGPLLGSLSGGEYAVARILHTAEAVEKAWHELFAALAENGLHFDPARPILERYTLPLESQNLCEICVPILRSL